MAGQEATHARVLLVDADARRRRAVRDVLGTIATIDRIDEAATATAARERVGHVDLALLDCELPDAGIADAIALLRRARHDLPVIALSPEIDPDTVRQALDAGALSFLSYRGAAASFEDAVKAALDGRGMLDTDVARPVLDRCAGLLEDVRERDRAVIESLATAVEAKDRVTSSHLRAVSRLAVHLASLVDPSLADSEDFRYGCVLHDVGKIGVPEQILAKPGPLTAAEWVVMRTHPRVGVDVIRPLGLSPVVGNVVLHHHERWDGRGYPDGLSDQAIPLEARIFAVCDALEAMTAQRPYRGPLPADVALHRIRAGSGRQFDPRIVESLDAGVANGDVDIARARSGGVLGAGT